MNLLLLSLGLRVWRGTPLHILTRLFAAISILSVEMQIATWTGLTTLRGLMPINVGLAAVLWWLPSRLRLPIPDDPGWTRHARYVIPAVLTLAVVVSVLNATLTLQPVDPYHLERMAQIERLGTLAYDPAVDRFDPRLNVLSWLYELLLVDIGLIPLVGTLLLNAHGLLGLALYTLTAWSLLCMLHAPAAWPSLTLFVVPLVFHQFVLLKNDLFGAVPAALALAWTVSRIQKAAPREIAWAGWLAGVAVSIKLTSYPVALVMGAFVLVYKRDLTSLGSLAAGGLLGALAGGTIFTLVENTRLYGGPLAPWLALEGRPDDLNAALQSVARMAVSLFDMGLLTRILWPHVGGWGGTYGLPGLWALIVLIVASRRIPEAGRTLFAVVPIWLLSSATNIDMGTNQRYLLAPTLLIVAVAVVAVSRRDVTPTWARRAAVVVIVLSAAQMLRSAVLYLVRM